MNAFLAKDEGVMLGKPTVAGTRLTVELILERLAAGEGIDRVVESYPRLDGESVGGALLFAAGRVEEMLARLGLTEEPLVDAVTALDEHSEEDERTEACPGATSATRPNREPCWPSRKRS